MVLSTVKSQQSCPKGVAIFSQIFRVTEMKSNPSFEGIRIVCRFQFERKKNLKNKGHAKKLSHSHETMFMVVVVVVVYVCVCVCVYSCLCV